MILANVTILCRYEGYYLSWNIHLVMKIWHYPCPGKMMQIHLPKYIHLSTMQKVILCLKIKVNFRLISHAGL